MDEERLRQIHNDWIGNVQPVGLLLSSEALVARGVVPDRDIVDVQRQLVASLETDPDDRPVVRDLPTFLTSFLGWRADDLAGVEGGALVPDALHSVLPEYGETLAPSFAVAAPEGGDGVAAWQMLIRVEADGTDLDKEVADDGRRWPASPHARFERLLRDTGVPVGLMFNDHVFRLVYAPKGEVSGFGDFPLSAMVEVAGRPILSAFHMLFREGRFFGAPDERLAVLLAESRKFQQSVSVALAGQVLAALHELLRGLHEADRRDGRTRIADLAREHPDHLYGGLLTALMRIVFVLFAEDRDLFPRDPLWARNYSLAGLYARLRDDEARHPDTMDERFGAWAQILALSRLIHGGARRGALRIVARRGRLFDPEQYPFLEGRDRQDDAPAPPLVPDGTVWRMLRRLLELKGERLSYRTLDVEQIGSVYQAVMGFTIELTAGPSLAVKPASKSGAAATIDLGALLAEAPAKRVEWLKSRTGRKLAAKPAKALKAAASVEDTEKALAGAIDRDVTPSVVGAGIPVLQPTEERRRTGSHYTPRDLTRPIVAEALRPVLERLGPDATPDEILELKVLDPAVGSGAFLVETCRQLGDRLVVAWTRHGSTPVLPPDEDALLHARRLVAQRCLYGVDRNPMAAELAKLSLWLATLARDHEFTFLDHAIRHGDALVGLDVARIRCVSWESDANVPFVARTIDQSLADAEAERRLIREADEDAGEAALRAMLARADGHLRDVILLGDVVVGAFFSVDAPNARNAVREGLLADLRSGNDGWQARLAPRAAAIRNGPRRLAPFHWPLMFPEVFRRDNPGFDSIVGNPPYSGKNGIIDGNPAGYLDWLQTIHAGAHGNADLVAHFFRRAFDLLRDGGTFGLIATKTIRQGDTRGTGLRWIRQNGGTIYAARRRYKWPGEAAVVVSVVHVAKGEYAGPVTLDGRRVARLTAYLFDQGGDEDPQRLQVNAGRSFQGSIVLGMGFTFDDQDTKGVANPVTEMHRLIAKDPCNAERIFPYIGGEEVNNSPTHANHRWVINFEDFPLRRDPALSSWDRSNEGQRKKWLQDGIVPGNYPGPVAADWPDLLEIAKLRVKPERDKVKDKGAKKYWWRFIRPRPELHAAIHDLHRVLAVNCGATPHMALTFLTAPMVFANTLAILSIEEDRHFAVLQSRVHEIWARFFGSSMKDDLRYTPSDVFETFPFPRHGTNTALDDAGRAYLEHRAKLMSDAGQGMTEIYNRFNDPNDMVAELVRLRDLHAEMDRAVLRAYGWDDLVAQAAPDFEREWDSDDDEGKGPWRLRWLEPVRDAVLARLLALNAERAAEEALEGASATPVRSAPTDIQQFRLV
jgi:hypothetical protein